MRYKVTVEHSAGTGRPPVRIEQEFSSIGALFGWAFSMGMSKDIRHFELKSNGAQQILVPHNTKRPVVIYTIEEL